MFKAEVLSFKFRPQDVGTRSLKHNTVATFTVSVQFKLGFVGEGRHTHTHRSLIPHSFDTSLCSAQLQITTFYF